MLAYEFEGMRYDCGTKLGYLQANVQFGLKHPEVGAEFARSSAHLGGRRQNSAGAHGPRRRLQLLCAEAELVYSEAVVRGGAAPRARDRGAAARSLSAGARVMRGSVVFSRPAAAAAAVSRWSSITSM